MTPEDKLLFAAARVNFPSKHQQTVLEICNNETIQWEKVYSTAERQGVAPLIYANLRQYAPSQLDIPEDILEQFELDYYRNVVRKGYIEEKLTEILTFLNRESIDVMVIKGAALDILVYEKPWYTVSNDVDLVLKPRREELTAHEDAQISTFFGDKFGFEYDYYAHHDVTLNGILPLDFDQIWTDATRIDYQGREVLVMCPEDLLIALCIGSSRKRFLRLKSLCDITETIDKYPELNWKKLALKANAYDCNNIVYAALLVTDLTLGIQLPEGALDSLAVHSLRAGIIRSASRNIASAPLTSFDTGKKLFGRHIDRSLILPYFTYRPYQIWRKLRFVWRTRSQANSGA